MLVLRSKDMFCEHYFLPEVKNVGSVKRYFHTFPFCFVFHVIKGFLVLCDLLKPTFEKSSQEKCQQISTKNQIISTNCIEVFA